MPFFCRCLSEGFNLCLPDLMPKVSSQFLRYQLVVSLGGFQDSVSASISSSSGLLNHKVFIKTVQVWQLAIKILIDSGVGFKDSKGKNKVILTSLS